MNSPTPTTHETPHETAPEPSPRTKLAFALAVAIGLLFLAYVAQSVIFVTITGVLFAIAFDALATRLMRWTKIGRTPAVIVAALVGLGALGGTIALMAVPVAKQGSAFVEALPEKTEKLRKASEGARKKYPILAGVLPAMDGEKPTQGATATETKDTVKGVAWFTSRVLEGLVSFVSIFFLGVFLALDPERYTEGVARLLPGRPLEERVELLYRIGAALRNYLVAMGIYIVAMAGLWALGLWLIGIDYFLLFGVIGGLVEVVPYVGPMIGLVPPLLVATSMGGSKVALVLGLYAILHVVEGYVLVPLLMEKREKLPPPVTLISILGFGAAFGFWGILLAVPLGTVVYVYVTHEILGEKDEEEEEKPAPEPRQTEDLRPGLAGGL